MSTIEEIIVAYEEFLDDAVDDYETSYTSRGVALLNAAEELGYQLRYKGDTFTDDLTCIPGHVYAIDMKG